MTTRYGTIHVRGHRPDDEMTYIISFDDAIYGAIEQRIDEAIAELKADTALLQTITEEHGSCTMRDLCCEMPDEPFNRRGITFVSVAMEYDLDGEEWLRDDEENNQ